MTDQISDDFRKAMSDWVAIKTQLTEARKDMKVLNTREKELKQYIADYMKDVKIDSVNLKKGKVRVNWSRLDERVSPGNNVPVCVLRRSRSEPVNDRGHSRKRRCRMVFTSISKGTRSLSKRR